MQEVRACPLDPSEANRVCLQDLSEKEVNGQIPLSLWTSAGLSLRDYDRYAVLTRQGREHIETLFFQNLSALINTFLLEASYERNSEI